MSTVSRLRWVAAAAVGLAWVAGWGLPAFAQNNDAFFSRAVGGVFIDAEGVVQSVELSDARELANVRRAALEVVPGDLAATTEFRKVSVRQLETAVAEHVRAGTKIPDDIRYLAGLQRIRYVVVDPESNDIILAGFAEGWRVDDMGNVVGLTTGRPVLLLDDLLVALRTAKIASQGGISCSIDPTSDGLARLQQFVARLSGPVSDKEAVKRAIEEQLGPQDISVHGVPATSHLARVLVAADYRMKRLAMNLDPTPIDGMPTYLKLIKPTSRGAQNMLPRWWLATNYEPLLSDASGLTWELRGQGVKVVTEDDFLASDGSRTHTGKASPAAQKWADNMTSRYDELSLKEPIFGQLRNVMDLTIISALMFKEDLLGKAGLTLGVLADDTNLATDVFPAPKQVGTQASLLRVRDKTIVSASGGVMIHSWGVADQKQTSEDMVSIGEQVSAGRAAGWWWN